MANLLEKIPPFVLVLILFIIGAILWKVVGAVLEFFFKYFKGVLDKITDSIGQIKETNQKFASDFRLMESKIQDSVKITDEMNKMKIEFGLMTKELQTNWKKYEELCRDQRKLWKRITKLNSNDQRLAGAFEIELEDIDRDEDDD